MEYKNNAMKEKGSDSEILFSKCVKAGKRVYYIDVKRDRKGEYYISMTESKRLKDQGDADHPMFEKHKIFLYREDLDKFQRAFNEVVEFTHEAAPQIDYASDWSGPMDDFGNPAQPADNSDFKIDIDF